MILLGLDGSLYNWQNVEKAYIAKKDGNFIIEICMVSGKCYEIANGTEDQCQEGLHQIINIHASAETSKLDLGARDLQQIVSNLESLKKGM